jgi:hypothetical protein
VLEYGLHVQNLDGDNGEMLLLLWLWCLDVVVVVAEGGQGIWACDIQGGSNFFCVSLFL